MLCNVVSSFFCQDTCRPRCEAVLSMSSRADLRVTSESAGRATSSAWSKSVNVSLRLRRTVTVNFRWNYWKYQDNLRTKLNWCCARLMSISSDLLFVYSLLYNKSIQDWSEWSLGRNCCRCVVVCAWSSKANSTRCVLPQTTKTKDIVRGPYASGPTTVTYANWSSVIYCMAGWRTRTTGCWTRSQTVSCGR